VYSTEIRNFEESSKAERGPDNHLSSSQPT
jgi:hypothetical protein